MKRFFALLCALVLITAPAIGDVLTPDWQSASLEDLTAAQALLANEISQRRAAELPKADAFVASGSGTGILSNIEIPYTPARVTFTADAKASLTLPSKYEHTYRLASAGTVVDFLDDPGTYNAMVTAGGSWSLTIEPIQHGQTLPYSGTGDGVSDFFDLSSPVIATITWDASGVTGLFNQLTVKLNHQYKNISSWKGDLLLNELNLDVKGSVDVILSPTQGRNEYCFVVSSAKGMVWSIAYK